MKNFSNRDLEYARKLTEALESVTDLADMAAITAAVSRAGNEKPSFKEVVGGYVPIETYCWQPNVACLSGQCTATRDWSDTPCGLKYFSPGICINAQGDSPDAGAIYQCNQVL